MKNFRLGASVVATGVLLVAACSAGGDGAGSSLGSGASSASGGSIGVSGNGSGAMGGTTTGQGGSGAAGGSISLSGSGGSGGTAGAKACLETTAISTPLVPTVAIVVDNSSSMYEPRDELWDPLYEALMDETIGAIKPLEDKVRFGFTAFRGVNDISVPEDDESCAELQSVDYALGNFAAIDDVYRAVGADARGTAGCSASSTMCQTLDWETPTGHAITRVAADLAAYMPDPPGKKYILLVTDGNPNTCMVGDPQCGQDVSIKAVQDAYAAEIGTFVIGIGDIVEANTGCTPAQMRCGTEHLQDLANAGTGQPVAAPPADYWYQQCPVKVNGTASNMGTPTATYAAAGELTGTSPYFTATTPDELRTALNGLLSDVVSCTFDMDSIVTGDPTRSEVLLEGTPLTYGDTAGGWILEPNKYQVTLQGTACETFKSASQGTESVEVSITFFCDEMGEPVAEPR